MNKERLTKIICAPCVSEKSTRVMVDRQYIFKVRTDATKSEIAQAVKLLFVVEVDKVCTIRVKGKARRFANMKGQRKDWKKAYVTVKEGQKIDLGGA